MTNIKDRFKKEYNDILSLYLHNISNTYANILDKLEYTIDNVEKNSKTLITLNEIFKNLKYSKKELESVMEVISGISDPVNSLFNLIKSINISVDNISALYDMKKKVDVILKYDKSNIFNIILDRHHFNIIFNNILKYSWENSKNNSTINILINENIENNKLVVSIINHGYFVSEKRIEAVNSDKLFINKNKEPIGRIKKGIELGLWLSKRLLQINNCDLKIENYMTNIKGLIVKLIIKDYKIVNNI